MQDFFYKIHRLIYAKTGVFDEVIFSLPIVLAIVLVYWTARRKSHKRIFGDKFGEIRKKSRLNEIIRLLLFWWLAEVVCLTLTPTGIWYSFWNNIISGQLLNFGIWKFSCRAPVLMPTVLRYAIDGHLDWLIISAKYDIPHFLANVAMFVPLGLSLPFVCKRISFKKSTLIGLSFSLAIEFLQCFIGRDSSVDDLICNTFGAIMGYLLYLLIKKLLPNFTEKGKISVKDFALD